MEWLHFLYPIWYETDPAASAVLAQDLMLHEIVTCCLRDTLPPRDSDGSSYSEAACYFFHIVFGSNEHCLKTDILMFVTFKFELNFRKTQSFLTSYKEREIFKKHLFK